MITRGNRAGGSATQGRGDGSPRSGIGEVDVPLEGNLRAPGDEEEERAPGDGDRSNAQPIAPPPAWLNVPGLEQLIARIIARTVAQGERT